MQDKNKKHRRVVTGIISIILLICVMVGCSKEVITKKKDVATKKGITTNSILSKVVDYYKTQNLKDIRMTTKSSIGVDKDRKMDLIMVFHNYFVNNDMKKCITNLNTKIIVDKKSKQINLYMNENGNIAYSIDNKGFYSADGMYNMLGVKYTAPKLVVPTKEPLEDEVEATDDIYKIDGTIEPTSTHYVEGDDYEDDSLAITESDMEDEEEADVTATPRKTYSIDHLNKLARKIVVKGNKEIDGRVCYVLKGQIQSVEIKNLLVTYLESSLYNLPEDFGNIEYEIYVDKEEYSINHMKFNIDNLISTLTKNKDVSGNDIEVEILYNTGKELRFPTLEEESVECYSQVLSAFDTIVKNIKSVCE